MTIRRIRWVKASFCLLALCWLLGAAGPADAGRLGKTVKGISRAGGGSRGSRGGGSSGGGSGGGGSAGHGHHHGGVGHNHHGAHHGYVAPWLWGGAGGGAGAASVQAGVAPVQIDFYGGWQKVKESDGSFQLGGGLGVGILRLAGRFSSYYERQGLTEEDPMLRFHLWSASGGVELFGSPTTALHAEGGVAGFASQGGYDPEVSGLGLSAGLSAEHWVDRMVGFLAEARVYYFADDVRASEARAGVQWTVVRASYRWLDFNVGPPLQGPEIGLALRF